MDNKTLKRLIIATKHRAANLSDKQKAALRALDRTSTNGFNGGCVVDIVGVFAGVKPAAFIELGAKLQPLIEALGLVYVPIDNEVGVTSRLVELAEELSVTMQSMWKAKDDNTEDNKKIGALLGYPATATDYYIRRLPTMHTDKALPIIDTPVGPGVPNDYYVQFILSPDYYESEIEQYVVPLEAAAKEFAPKTHKLYERLVRDEQAVIS